MTHFLRLRTLTGGNEDDVDAEDGVREPSVEAVEAGHLQGGVEHSSERGDTQGVEKQTQARGQCVRVGGWGVSPDGLLHRLADDVGGGSGLGERRQVDHPLDWFVIFTAGAQQVEESGEKNHLEKYDDKRKCDHEKQDRKLELHGILKYKKK